MVLVRRFEKLKITNILDVDAVAADALLHIRNEANVRSKMYSDHLISREEHRRWLDGLRHTNSRKFYLVETDDGPVGGVGLSNIDRKHGRADWAFYLTGSATGKGLGATLEFTFVNQAFEIEHLHKLNCEVIAFNEPVIRLHKKFGFVEEGRRRDHVRRDGAFYDTVLLGITKEEWQAEGHAYRGV